nr:hypothetical protein [Pantoea sp. 201603H]
MSKRISNRIARRILGGTHYHSNTRIMTRSGSLVQVNPSRRQRRANKRILAIRAAIRERNERGGDHV